MMKNKRILNTRDVKKLRYLANETRKHWGVFFDVPVGNDLVKLLEDKENIIICEYPFKTISESHTDATITIFETNYGKLTFMGLNSSIYMDEQIFALAHELYHYLTQTGKAYHLEDDVEDAVDEAKADRFAAELLLPFDALTSKVEKYFPDGSITGAPYLRLLRFVAVLQGEWWLPFRSVVMRLHEENIITTAQYEELMNTDCRDLKGDYSKIFENLDPTSHKILNYKSEKIRISQEAINATISNYEDGDISYEELVETLELFNMHPSDFGYTVTVELDDDMSFLFKEDNDEG